MGATVRVAFFADSFHEVNGLALTARALDAWARQQALPWVTIRGARRTHISRAAGAWSLDLRRSWLSVPLDPELSFDPLWPRHAGRVIRALDRFAPDVIHITGVNDMGQLGAWIARRRAVPLVASWHTNVHEFAARRVRSRLAGMGEPWPSRIAAAVEQGIWRGLVQFYRMARVLLAPNPRLASRLEAATGRPVRLMRRGVDTSLFRPRPGRNPDGRFRIGYVGRLEPEKNVRMLAAVEEALAARSARSVEILVVGEGSERRWLEQRLRQGVFPGVLRGEALAEAYASMDLFVFPSETDTFGNVVLEALASGVPAIVTDRGGPQSIVRPGSTGLVARGAGGFADAVRALMTDPPRLARMKADARRQACECAWHRVFEQVHDVYRAVVAGSDTVVDARALVTPLAPESRG